MSTNPENELQRLKNLKISLLLIIDQIDQQISTLEKNPDAKGITIAQDIADKFSCNKQLSAILQKKKEESTPLFRDLWNYGSNKVTRYNQIQRLFKSPKLYFITLTHFCSSDYSFLNSHFIENTKDISNEIIGTTKEIANYLSQNESHRSNIFEDSKRPSPTNIDLSPIRPLEKNFINAPNSKKDTKEELRKNFLDNIENKKNTENIQTTIQKEGYSKPLQEKFVNGTLGGGKENSRSKSQILSNETLDGLNDVRNLISKYNLNLDKKNSENLPPTPIEEKISGLSQEQKTLNAAAIENMSKHNGGKFSATSISTIMKQKQTKKN